MTVRPGQDNGGDHAALLHVPGLLQAVLTWGLLQVLLVFVAYLRWVSRRLSPDRAQHDKRLSP